MSELHRPWLPNYASGVPANINPDQHPTLISIINENLAKHKNKVAFSNFGKEITYKEVDKLATQFGAYLQSRGLEAGDRIALMMPNLLQYPIALFGALRAGLIVVNTNPLYTEREMHHQFVDAGVKAIVIAENFASKLEHILKDTDINCVITTSVGEMLGAIKGNIVNFVVKNIKKGVPKFNIPNTVSFKEALSNGKKFEITAPAGSSNDTILLQYTGGTTGVAKGAMLTNRNLVANMLQIHALLAPELQDEETVYVLSPLPMYHIFSFTVNCLAMMQVGATNVLVTNPRDLKSVSKEFKRYPISMMTGVNTLFNALINDKTFNELDFSALKICVAGGMAVQRIVAENWQKVTGCFLSEGYGMTESSPVASCNPVKESLGRIGTIGLPIPSTDMRVVDEAGQELPVGERGEIQIKGPQVMKGYYNRPDETAKALKDGWLSTGDIGMMFEDGFFKIVDRKKDMILVSGFNVYPNEVEDIITQHPKVLEAAVIGIPSEKSGEAVKVFIVKKDNSLKEKEIIAYCKENLTGYKVPKQIEFRKELPKSNVGKILRRLLKEENKSA